MEEENIGGPERGHDPHQPAHVTSPRTQLPQVQPVKALTGGTHLQTVLPNTFKRT